MNFSVAQQTDEVEEPRESLENVLLVSLSINTAKLFSTLSVSHIIDFRVPHLRGSVFTRQIESQARAQRTGSHE